MREPENCSFSYCGFESPHTFDEIQFEVLGLENLIKIVVLNYMILIMIKLCKICFNWTYSSIF